MSHEIIDPKLFTEAARRVIDAENDNDGVTSALISIPEKQPDTMLHTEYDFSAGAYDALTDAGIDPEDTQNAPLVLKVAEGAEKLVPNAVEVIATRKEKADQLNNSPARRAILKARGEDIDPKM